MYKATARVGVLLCASVCACAETAPLSNQPPSDLYAPVERFTLDNGFEVLVQTNRTVPIVTAVVVVRAGSFYEVVEVLARRLYEQVRNEQGLAYTVGARLYEGHVSNGVFWLSSDQPEAAIAVASQTVTDTIQGTTQKQVDTARAQILRRLLSEAHTPDGIARLLGRYELLHGDRAPDYAAALDEATAPEVCAALRAFFSSLSLAAAGSGDPLEVETLATLEPKASDDSALAALFGALN